VTRICWLFSNVYSIASKRNECQDYSLGGKGDWCIRLETLPRSCAICLGIWQPQPPGNLRVSTGNTLPFLGDLKRLWISFFFGFKIFEQENDCKIVCLEVNIKYVRTLWHLKKECWRVCYVIGNYIFEWHVTGLSVLKIRFQTTGLYIFIHTYWILDVTYFRKRYWTLSLGKMGFSNKSSRESIEIQTQMGEPSRVSCYVTKNFVISTGHLVVSLFKAVTTGSSIRVGT